MADDDSMAFSEQSAADLMEILLERGYFHENVKPVKSSEIVKDSDPPRYTEEDAVVVETQFGTYLTLEYLNVKFREELEKVGRCTLQKAADRLSVSLHHVKRILPTALEQDNSLLSIGDEVMTTAYLDETIEFIYSSLRNSEGKASVTVLARDSLRVPVEDALRVLQERLPSDVEMRLQENGSKVFVTQKYLNHYRSRVMETFRALREPTSVQSTCHEKGWETSWTLRFLQEDEDKLPGKLHGDSYVPDAYVEEKRRAVVEFFASNGFVTTEKCHLLEILPSQMIEYVRDGFADALVLEESVIDADRIISPLEAVVQETIESGSWMDLQLHLPMELLSTADAHSILNDHVLSKMESESPGVAVVTPNGSIFFSQTMIDEIAHKVLPPLIESFAKARAKEMDRDGEGEITSHKSSSKSKRKSRKSSNKSKEKSEKSNIVGSIPVDHIVKAIVAAHPDLTQAVQGDPNMPNSPIVALYQQSLMTDEFREACERAVHAELRQLQMAKVTKVSASKLQSVEGAFEDPSCFATACYSIQSLAKFLNYAASANVDEETLEALKKEFLRGCCADFTSRISQYCLFRNEIEEGTFCFGTDGLDEETGLAYFCSPVDPARRRYDRTYLTCEPDENLKPRDPLPTLREVLPANVGVVLARQWILCGGDCYQGGIKESEDGETYTRPGAVDGFLDHVEENCLTLCGLPFKKIDKKSEKQFLFNRRQRLTHLLEGASDAETVLELTIMLLYQLVKNVVVCGSLLCRPILQLLVKERKISEDVAMALCGLSESLERGEDIDQGQIERVRACGLSRDITKHQIG